MKNHFGLLFITFAAMVITLAADMFLRIFIATNYGLPFHSLPLIIVGSLLVAGGLLIGGLTSVHMARVVRSGKLAMTGPYAFSRNPLYASITFLIMPGIAIVLHCAITLVIVPLLMYRYFLAHIKQEEEILEKQFGAEYRAYKSSVERLIPKCH